MEEVNIASYYKEYDSSVYASIEAGKTAAEGYYEVCKRLLDIFLALIGLIVGIPLMIIFGAIIMIETPGAAIYTQTRVGKGGKIFTIYKLRSMGDDAEKNGAQWAQQNDPRVTKVGAFIRKTRIDEIPQVFNVLKGDMSIVGPRPERPSFTLKFNKDIPRFISRLHVKPGLTGWAQVNGGYDMTPREKWEADMYYIENCNLMMDLRIIFKTVRIVLTGEGAR